MVVKIYLNNRDIVVDKGQKSSSSYKSYENKPYPTSNEFFHIEKKLWFIDNKSSEEYYYFCDDTLYELLDREINDRIIPIEKLNKDYQSIFKKDEETKKNFLQNLFKSDVESNEELSSLLYHFLSNCRLRESLFYLVRLIARCHTESSILLCIRYSYNPYDYENDDWFRIKGYKKYDDEDIFYEFLNPNFGEFLLRIIEELYDKTIERWGYLNENYSNFYDYFEKCIVSDTLNSELIYEHVEKYEPYISEKVLSEFLPFIFQKEDLDYFIWWVDKFEIQLKEIKNKYGYLTKENYGEFYRDQRLLEIYNLRRSLISNINSFIYTISIIKDRYNDVEFLFRRILNYDFLNEREIEKISKVVADGRKKQDRLKLGKVKSYKNPYKNEPSSISWFSDKYSRLTPPVKRIRNERWYDRKYFYGEEFKYGDRECDGLEKLENDIRDEFGIPKKGEQWVSETSVFYMVSKLLESKGVYVTFHYRPKFLDGLELDVYFEYYGNKVGLEYQGKQHFEPIEFFGGEESYKSVVIRDNKKKILCQENGVKLIYYNYWEEISESVLKGKLKDIIK